MWEERGDLQKKKRILNYSQRAVANYLASDESDDSKFYHLPVYSTPLMLILPVLRSGTAGFKQNVYKQYTYKCGR